jgi:hypothetical protein
MRAEHAPSFTGPKAHFACATGGVLLLIVASLGCALRGQVPASSPQVPPPSVRAVFQLQWGGGMGGVNLAHVTLWEDGTTLSGDPGKSLRIGSIGLARLAQLMDQARVLYDLDDRYTAIHGDDLPTATFTVETERGRKSVRVYGFNPDPRPNRPGEPSVVEQLRRLYRAVHAALPQPGVPLVPTEVVVHAHPMGAHFGVGLTREWPKELLGWLTGEEARRALDLAGLDNHLHWIDGDVYAIGIRPIVPILDRPWDEWPQDGLPRHPGATAYTSHLPQDTDYYRFLGVSKAEIADWYAAEMERRGWRRANDTESDAQVWVRKKYSNDPLLRIVFAADHFTVENFSGYEGAVPHHPSQFQDHDCQGKCLFFRRVGLDETRAWYREYLGYAGWIEMEPDVFVGMLTGLSGSRSYPELRMSYEQKANGTRVHLDRAEALVPAAGWPTPPAWVQDPLCEATRGIEVNLPTGVVALPQAVCVTVDQPARIRVQVAYGRSFVEFDRLTGRLQTAYGWPGEAPLFIHLSAISGMPPAFFEWPRPPEVAPRPGAPGIFAP